MGEFQRQAGDCDADEQRNVTNVTISIEKAILYGKRRLSGLIVLFELRSHPARGIYRRFPPTAVLSVRKFGFMTSLIEVLTDKCVVN